MKLLALALLLVACREQREATAVVAAPLTPSGNPVATNELPPTDDISDELPPSLFEASAQPVDKTDKLDEPKTKPRPIVSSQKLASITAPLCVTTGAAKIGARIEKPAMRAVAKTTDGEAAVLEFTFHGETATKKKLASGSVRRQLGLKLRAENGCNLLYVMWRLDPRPMVDVQMKRNPGAKDHKACGAGGYKKIKPSDTKPPPELVFGEKHTLRAEIENELLSVYIDDDLHWRGKLPDDAKQLRGPAGLRSDNLAFDLVNFGAPATSAQRGNAKCLAEDGD